MAVGVTAAGPGRWVLLAVSLALLGRAHYVATWRGHGAAWSKATVWLATGIVGVLWYYRL